MLLIITTLTFLLIASIAFFLLFLLGNKRESVINRLEELELSSSPKGMSSSKESRTDRVFDPLSKLIPKSPKEAGATRKKLMQAGYKGRSALSIFYSIKLILIVTLPLGFYFSGLARTMPSDNVMILYFACFIGGYILPDFFLSRRVTARRERIQLALPDALDLLVVCVEAGLGLDQAIMKTSEELRVTHPDICDELEIVNLELRTGKPRREALKNLADRTGVDDIQGLVSMLIQTDKFGTSIATSLRVHSDALRTKRRQRAEERAHKVSVKLVFPLVFLIFPSMFVVILGPGAITIYNTLLKGGW
jgi:tight adherence protein C